MSERFFIEGHKSKISLEDENTLIISPESSFATLKEAAKKARKYFEEKKDLSLAVIYKEELTGEREGVRLIYKDDEGKLEEYSFKF